MKFVIGLTGTIASGKSTAGAYLSRKASLYVDADKVGHQVVEEEKEHLASMFGPSVIKDGHLDRKALGAIVFSDPQELAKLNRYTHPLICSRIADMVDKIPDGLVVIEAIELIRTPLKDLVDQIWVVWAEPQVRIKRMVTERGLTEQEARERIKSQWDDETYRRLADVVIVSTDGPVEDLYRQIEQALEQAQDERKREK